MKNIKHKFFLLFLIIADCVLIYILGMTWLNKNEEVRLDTKSVMGNNELINLSTNNDIYSEHEYTDMVIPSGEPIGIYVKSEGVMVIGVGEITGEDGNSYVPCAGLVNQGDYILKVNNTAIDDKQELIDIVNSSGGNEVELTLKSFGGDMGNSDIDIYSVMVKPVKNNTGSYMLGLWVKDDISGIGTLTFYDESGFSALGHSINDNDTGEIFAISDGAIYKANLVNIVKSDNHTPGRLEGLIDYSSKYMMGRIENNEDFGISGYLTNAGKEVLNNENYVPVAKKEEIELGEAYIMSSVSGESKYYSVEITNILYDSADENKEIEIKITDPELIKLTSGIVQGMSGTPILQDGKLVGAVTHVLVNDPTRGYGIFIENMMK